MWIERILEDRFGHTFSLKVQPDNTLQITLEGAPTYIALSLDGATFNRADSDLPCTHWNAAAEGWQTVLEPNLPAPGATTLPSPLIERTTEGWNIQYDILGLTYWMLSRQEEVGRTDLDEHGRFPATSSHAFKHGYLERPIVDEWLYILRQVMERTWPSVQLKKHLFSIKVSHDVDSPSMYAFKHWKIIARRMLGHILIRKDLSAFLTSPLIKIASKSKLHSADPFNKFDWLMDVAETHNLKSAFYFICGRSSEMDADYEPEHPAIRELMRRIHRRGHEIGLHPSYGSYQTPSLIKQEAERLRKIAAEEEIKQSEWGGRMHYLRWDQTTTLKALSEAGMTYDSTLGYADRPGFRCGTCYEYRAFDPISQMQLNLKILPLLVMDSTLISNIYMRENSMEEKENLASKIKNNARKVNGIFTLLWHNSNLYNNEWRNMYKRMLS